MSRETEIHCARVYLSESRRRGRSQFAHLLLTWAGNARRRAAAVKQTPVQLSFLGEQDCAQLPPNL